MVAPIKAMKWMILGGEGQLGRAMALELAKNSIEYISLSRGQLDITNQDDIEAWLAKEVPSVVLNAAAWTNVDAAESEEESAFLVNALGPKLIAAACSATATKYIQISTDYVFSGNSDSPWGEWAEPSPISAYGRTKAQGERLVLDTYPNGSYIVRTAWLYSPWGKNFAKTMMEIAIQESRKVEVVNNQVGQPTSATDLAFQLHKMVTQNVEPGIYHGTNSGQTTWFEFAKDIFAYVGLDSGRVIPVSSEHFPRTSSRPVYSVLGHNHWFDVGMHPMRNWRTALIDSLPAVFQAVKQR